MSATATGLSIMRIRGRAAMDEFSMIEKYFRPLTEGHAGSANLQDDAAVLSVPSGHEIVITSDTLNEGTHFLKGENPEHIARKALRVNLSDLAATGAQPLCYQLNLAFPEKPSESWLVAFTKALQEDQKTFGIFCSGGDTTGIMGDCLSISITAIGTVPAGKALRRGGARAGDVIILTGCIGDAYLGLKSLYNTLDYPHAIARYRTPLPRLQISALRDQIHAAADISDGLIADLGHIAKASGLRADIELGRFIFSPEVQDAIGKGIITQEQAIIGGDDYELVLAVPPNMEQSVIKTLGGYGLSPFTIGVFSAGSSVHVLDPSGAPVFFDSAGWAHF